RTTVWIKKPPASSTLRAREDREAPRNSNGISDHKTGAILNTKLSRHSHPKARPETPVEEGRPTTGIDYLGLIDTAHKTDLADKVNYAALGDPTPPVVDLTDLTSE
ncbi:hypothetical protein ACFV8W_43015, partial [Streptomyces sp. NPDC059786]